jgi:RNA-splicing ligase RtcB
MKALKTIGIIFLCLLIIFGTSFIGQEWDIFSIHYWGVRKENARREVFENTQSYVEGKRQDLIRYHHEWVNASPEDKKAIESTVRQAFSEFDENKFIETREMYDFLKHCKYE